VQIYLLLPSPCHIPRTPSTTNQLTLRCLSVFQTLASANTNNSVSIFGTIQGSELCPTPRIVLKISANARTVPGASPLSLQYLLSLLYGFVPLLSHISDGAYCACSNFRTHQSYKAE